MTGSAPGHPATAVLGVLSYLAPDDIPRQLLAPGTVRNAPVLGGLTPVQVSVALASLADYSLITLDTNAIAVHRVIQHLTRLDAETRDMAIPYCSTAISLLNPASNPIPAAGLLPHILDATARAQHLNAAPAATVRLLNSATFRLLDAGQVDTARPLLDRALDIAREVLGPDHPETLTARGNLARWLGETGQPAQAADQFRDLLTDVLRVLGPDHPDTLTTRGSLARWVGEAGQPAQAADQFRDLLTDALRVLGPDHPDTLIIRGYLAYMLGLAGQLDQAAAQYRDLLADRRRVLGPGHPHTLSTRASLARVLGEAGRLDQAAAQFRDLLTDALRVLGPDHRDTLATRSSLAYWQSKRDSDG